MRGIGQVFLTAIAGDGAGWLIQHGHVESGGAIAAVAIAMAVQVGVESALRQIDKERRK